MRRRKIRALALLAAMHFAAVTGCNPRNQAQGDYTPSVARLGTLGSDTLGLAHATRPPEGAAMEPPAPAAIAVQLLPLVDGAVQGHAELSSFGALTRGYVEIRNGDEAAHYALSFHAGSCERRGAQVGALPTVTADSLGAGASEGHANLPLAHLRDAPHVLVVSRFGIHGACGAVSGAAVPATAPPL